MNLTEYYKYRALAGTGEGGGGENNTFIVTVERTLNTSTWIYSYSSDTSISEIIQAAEEGKLVFAKLQDSSVSVYAPETYSLQSAADSAAEFVCYTNYLSDDGSGNTTVEFTIKNLTCDENGTWSMESKTVYLGGE